MGGWLFQTLGLSIGGGIIGGLIPPIVGAVLVLLVVKAIRRSLSMQYLHRPAARDWQLCLIVSLAVVMLTPARGGATGGVSLEQPPVESALADKTWQLVRIMLGCERAERRVWCDVKPFRGGPRGYVAADYLTPAISPNGAAIMGPDNSALRAGQGDFDASGSIPCAQTACAANWRLDAAGFEFYRNWPDSVRPRPQCRACALRLRRGSRS